MNKSRALSERLQSVADLLLRDTPMADIGTDHGALPLYCLQADIVPYAVLSDVNEAPLAIARERMEGSFVERERFDLRLGSGLCVLKPGEVQTVVIAGMGGELIASILEQGGETTERTQRFVFQPRSRAGVLRNWLWEHGWRILEERLAFERGRLCQVFAAEKGSQTPYEYADIPQCEDPRMTEFLEREIRTIHKVCANLAKSSDPRDGETLRALQTKAAALCQRREALCKNRNS